MSEELNFEWPKFPERVTRFVETGKISAKHRHKFTMQMTWETHTDPYWVYPIWLVVFPVAVWALVMCWPWIDKWLDQL